MLRRLSRNYRGLDQREEEVNAVSRVLVQSDDEAMAPTTSLPVIDFEDNFGITVEHYRVEFGRERLRLVAYYIAAAESSQTHVAGGLVG
jgi:hypothetical protein